MCIWLRSHARACVHACMTSCTWCPSLGNLNSRNPQKGAKAFIIKMTIWLNEEQSKTSLRKWANVNNNHDFFLAKVNSSRAWFDLNNDIECGIGCETIHGWSVIIFVIYNNNGLHACNIIIVWITSETNMFGFVNVLLFSIDLNLMLCIAY